MRCAVVSALTFLIGCGSAPGDGVSDDEEVPGLDAAPGGDRPDAGADACEEMDILFVVDNSLSMEEEQDNLASNFPRFVSVLEAFRNRNGAAIDYHLGVTTTGISKAFHIPSPFPGFPETVSDVHGEDGHLQLGAGCGMPRGWLERGDPDVASKFGCAARVGIDGSVDEMPLEGARLALTDRLVDGSNAGFVREKALLALVFLTDEEDCSQRAFDIPVDVGAGDVCGTADTVASYVEALDAVKGDRSRWASAVIAGVSPQPCHSALGEAAVAYRLIDFSSQVGDNSATSSICEGDLTGALDVALNRFQEACDSIIVE